jgi:class 3 adenylate cyclase
MLQPFKRISNPLEWCAADRCLLAALVCLTFNILYILAGLYYLSGGLNLDYVDPVGVRLFFRFAIFALAPGWALIAVAALLLRRRSPENRILVLATALHYAIGFGICSYFFGYFTSLFPGLVIVAGWTFGLTLFDRKPVVVAGIVFLAFVGATTLADWFGWIPYGPLLSSAPYEAGHLSGWFLVTIGAITGILLLAVLVLIDFIIENWHRHQKQIVAMSEQLSQANEVISRYVASQLAQKIRDGQHDDAALPSRRRLTLVFSDIVGFSDTADELEPEDLSQLLNEYLAEMTALAEKYGATVDKFVGDAVVCFFGAPAATDDRDHALRAVRMALEMNRRVAELAPSWSNYGARRPLLIRIGINTGVASIGSFGSRRRMDYTAIGRQVNLAARLETQCEPGNVLMSQSTYALVADEIPCQLKGEIRVKGIHHPVQVYSPSGSYDDTGIDG